MSDEPMRRDEALDILAATAEDWNKRTAEMVATVAGLIMASAGIVEFTIKTSDVEEFLLTHRVNRVADGTGWTFTVEDRANETSVPTGNT